MSSGMLTRIKEPSGWLKQVQVRDSILKCLEFPTAAMRWVKSSPRINVCVRQVWNDGRCGRATGTALWSYLPPRAAEQGISHPLQGSEQHWYSLELQGLCFILKQWGIKLLQVEFDNTVIKTDCSYLLPLPYQQAQKRFWHLGETYIFPIVQAELLHARVAEICPFLGHTWWWQQINSGQLCCSALCTGACSDDLVEFIWPQGRINSTFRF